jgi:glycosyltransferase involved in cell wall biosynthesis
VLTIAVDTGPLHGPATGIARATSGIVDELARRDVSLVPYVLSFRARLEPGTRRIPLPAALALRAWGNWGRPRVERLWRGVDVIHGTNYVVPPSRVPRLVSVYDCWALDHPQYVHADVRLAMSALRRSIADGAVIHSSSHATARRLRAHFPEATVEVIHLGSTPPRPAPFQVPASLPAVLADAPFIASIGTVERRKNVPTLVAAFGLLADRSSDVHLVVAGGMGDDSPMVDAALAALDPAVRARVHVLGRVDDDSAAWLLRRARVLAYPSLDEGFGFPLLEAMECDVPIVASDAGSIPEVAGDAALFVAASDTESLARGLALAADDESTRSRLIAAGRTRRTEFSWTSTVDQLVALYERMAR